MLGVVYAERAIYALKDDCLDTNTLLAVGKTADRRVTRLASPTSPVFTVPHLYDTECAAYLHTCAIAEIAADRALENLFRKAL